MFGIDWTNLELYHYLAIGGGGAALLALVLYFVLPRGFRIPTGVLGTVAGLLAGVGIGVVGMAAYGHRLPRSGDAGGEGGPPPDMAGGMQVGMAPDKGMPGGKGMPMPGFGGPGGGFGGPGGGKGKGKGPSPKTQLTALVRKMSQLTVEPLRLTLTDEQRKVIGEQLKDLPNREELSDDDAKKCLDAILDTVKDNRKTLEAAGYNWPGGGGGGLGAPSPQLPNPFKEGEAHDHLLALRAGLAKKS